MAQQIKLFLPRQYACRLLPLALIVFGIQSCSTPARDHYMNLTHSVIDVGAPELDDVALAFDLPLYQPPIAPESASALAEVPFTEQP